jgi:hypothetical protein
MKMNEVTRRQILSSVGLTGGASLLAGCEETLRGSALHEEITSERTANRVGGYTSDRWRYTRLDPAVVAAEAYRQFVDGGCMYGLCAGIMAMMAVKQGEPYLSFPVHMMKYGAGGVGEWGSLCGAVNGGAAIIGLFEQDRQRRDNLIAQLLAWYETSELPNYQPKAAQEPEEIPKTVAGSILCHASVGNWCKASGDEIGSPEMRERCRRLTADVAAKMVELLNANLHEPCKFAGLAPQVKSCLSCHSKELHDTLGKMQCDSCHQQLSTKHPTVPNLSH